MVRPSKLALWTIVAGLAAVSGLAYFGYIESVVSPATLPGEPLVGVVVMVGVVILGILTSQYLDKRAWKQTGKRVGLHAGGQSQFTDGPPRLNDQPTLRGTVNGRPVRAWTYTTGEGSSTTTKTLTVVETELDTPVEWHAAFGTPQDVQDMSDPPMDAVDVTSIDGVRLRGDISEERAQTLLTPRVKDAVTSIEGEVSVGSAIDNLLSDMQESLDDGGMMGSMAEGMLQMAGDPDDGPQRIIEHRGDGLVTDAAELERRIEAVTAVADAVDSTTSAAQG